MSAFFAFRRYPSSRKPCFARPPSLLRWPFHWPPPRIATPAQNFGALPQLQVDSTPPPREMFLQSPPTGAPPLILLAPHPLLHPRLGQLAPTSAASGLAGPIAGRTKPVSPVAHGRKATTHRTPLYPQPATAAVAPSRHSGLKMMSTSPTSKIQPPIPVTGNLLSAISHLQQIANIHLLPYN